jgi:VanZ family protein
MLVGMLKSILQTQPPLTWQIAALVYTALLTLLLLQSSSQPIVGPAAPPGPPDLGREILLTSGHIVGFALLVLVWWWALSITSNFSRALVLTVVISLTLGIVTELLQNFVPDRSSSLFDLAVNTVVTLVTATIIYKHGSRIFS